GSDPLGVQLVQIDPSGTTFRGNGFAIGAGSDEALDVLTKGYRENLRLEEAIALNTKAIESLNGGGTAIEHGVITRETGKFVHQNGGKAPKPSALRTN
ncbi:MAG: hypothetical protein E6K16_04500, partial [Methanobacteriota archaeon]